jgi:CheY-like chemotaxis protein
LEPNCGAAEKITILVDDDAPAISTVDTLEDLGHDVIEANSADRALENLRDDCRPIMEDSGKPPPRFAAMRPSPGSVE